jgi:hypothetical protein
LSEETLNGLRITRDAVNFYGGSVTDVPITPVMSGYCCKYLCKVPEEVRKRAETTLKERRKKEMMD